MGTVEEKVVVNYEVYNNLRDFAKQMTMPQQAFRKMGMATRNFTSRFMENISAGQKFAIKLRYMTAGLRGFRMEMLGVMFFGMAMQRFFKGLITPALQMVGAFDLLNTTLGIVFLPIALAIVDALTPIMIFLMEMPESVKMAVGWIAILGMAFGWVLMLVGQIALGIGSITVAIGEGFMTLEGLVSILSTIGTVFATISGIIIAGILLWKSNIGGFRDYITTNFKILLITIIKTFTNLKDIIIGVFALIIDVIRGDWKSVFEKDLPKIVMGTVNLVVDLFKGMVATIINLNIWMANTIKDLLLKGIFGGLMYALQRVVDLIGKIPFFRKISESLSDAISDVASIASSVGNIPYYNPFEGSSRNTASSSNMGQGFSSAFGNGSNVNVTVIAPNEYTVLYRKNPYGV